MAMPAIAPEEMDDFDEGGLEVLEAVAAVAVFEADERLEPCGRASPGLSARVAAAAARFWTASWVGEAGLITPTIWCLMQASGAEL